MELTHCHTIGASDYEQQGRERSDELAQAPNDCERERTLEARQK